MRLLAHLHLRIGRLRHFTRWLPSLRAGAIPLQLRDGLDSRLRPGDALVLVELLELRPYGIDFDGLAPSPRVVDIGANVGLATIALSRQLPGARFACVEVSPASFELLEENLRRNAIDACTLNAPAVGRTGDRRRVVEGASPALTRVEPADDGLPGLTISEVLDRAGFDEADLLKLDVEGAEAELFAAAGTWAERVRAIVAELHPPLTTEGAAQMLAPYGFRPVPLPPGKRHAGLLYAIRDAHPLD